MHVGYTAILQQNIHHLMYLLEYTEKYLNTAFEYMKIKVFMNTLINTRM